MSYLGVIVRSSQESVGLVSSWFLIQELPTLRSFYQLKRINVNWKKRVSPRKLTSESPRKELGMWRAAMAVCNIGTAGCSAAVWREDGALLLATWLGCGVFERVAFGEAGAARSGVCSPGLRDDHDSSILSGRESTTFTHIGTPLKREPSNMRAEAVASALSNSTNAHPVLHTMATRLILPWKMKRSTSLVSMIARCASDSIVTGEMLIVRDIEKCIFSAAVKHNLAVNTQRTPGGVVAGFREKVSSERCSCCIFVTAASSRDSTTRGFNLRFRFIPQ